MDIRRTILNVIQTLNGVTVQGKSNLDRLLGCIIALENTVRALDEKEAETDEGQEE